MSEPKFTPRPWERVGAKVLDKEGFTIAKCGWLGQSDEEGSKNGDLIAAAPDFYEDEEKKLVFLRTLKISILLAIRKLPGLYFEVSEMLNASVQSIDIIIRETEELLAKARGEVRE